LLRSVLILALLCVRPAQPVLAEPPPPSLTLSEAVHAALAADAALASSEQRVRLLEQAARLAGAPPSPTVRLAAVAGDDSEDSNFFEQVLELGGQPAMRRRVADAELRAATAARDARVLEVTFAVAQLYARATTAVVAVDLAEQEQQAQDRLYALAERRFQAGDVPESHVVRAARDRLRAARELAVAERERDAARESLSVRLGRPVPDALAGVPEIGLPADLPTLLQQATVARPELRQLRAEADARAADVGLTAAARSPFLELTAYRARLWGSDPETGARAAISFPLWDWGRQRAAEAQARAVFEDARARWQAAERDVAGQVQEARARWLARRAERETLETGELAQALRLVGMLERGYEGGAVTQLELLEARRALLETRREAARLRAEETTAALDLLRALGQSPPGGSHVAP